MSKFIIEMIRDDISDKECPDFVLMNKEDVLLLLKLVEIAEKMAHQTEKFEELGFKTARGILDAWRSHYFHEV